MEIPRKKLLKKNGFIWLIIVILAPLYFYAFSTGDNDLIFLTALLITVVIAIKEVLEERDENKFLEYIFDEFKEIDDKVVDELEKLEKKENEENEGG